MRAIGMDPVHDTRACFRSLVDAMSRPGTVQSSPVEPADHAVLATLVDHEVSLYTPDETIRTALANEGRLSPADVETASVVHITEPGDARVHDATRGTRKEPSEGATVVYRVEGLAAKSEGATERTAASDPAEWTTIRVSGPGVPDERTLAIEGFPPATARALADAQSTFPRGVDAVLATTDRVAALPRSADLEVA